MDIRDVRPGDIITFDGKKGKCERVDFEKEEIIVGVDEKLYRIYNIKSITRTQ